MLSLTALFSVADEFWDRPGACTRRQALATHVTAVLHLAECCAEREVGACLVYRCADLFSSLSYITLLCVVVSPRVQLHLTVLRDHVDVRWHNAKGEVSLNC